MLKKWEQNKGEQYINFILLIHLEIAMVMGSQNQEMKAFRLGKRCWFKVEWRMNISTNSKSKTVSLHNILTYFVQSKK